MCRMTIDAGMCDKAVLNVIQQKRQTTAHEIAKKTGYTAATVQKSIDRLRKTHREIDCIRGYGGGIFWEPIAEKKEEDMPSLTTVNSKDVLQSDFDTLQHAYDDLNEKYNALFENSRSVEKRVREEYEGFVEPLVYANAKKTADEYKKKYEEAIEDLNEVNKELYYVKAYVDDFGDEGSTNIAIEIPAHTAEDFRYVFTDCAKALAQARNNIQDSYNKNKESLDESNQPFKVTGCSVGNEDKKGKIITDFGNTIYSYNTRYLKPQLTIQSEKSGTYTIYYKLYTPNGTLSTGTCSPSGYSTSSTINIKAGTYTYKLSGWGADTAGNWKAGNYKYEFYCNGASLGYYEFTIK